MPPENMYSRRPILKQPHNSRYDTVEQFVEIFVCVMLKLPDPPF